MNKINPIQGKVQFPKNTNKTSIISFGDWSKTEAGNYTRGLLSEYLPKIDALVFLGDQGYDMYKKHGKIGNKFLSFSKSITSNIPYQVN